MQDIETFDRRPPRDIDAVSFVRAPPGGLIAGMPLDWLNPAASKLRYRVDHYVVNLSAAGEIIVEATRYWSGLFSHTREGVWKGMLRVELASLDDDAEARSLLAEGHR